MCVLPSSLSAGAGWWPSSSISCMWHAPWELPCTDHGNAKSDQLPPGQVRRMMPTFLSQLGTPARPCQPRGKAPGRPKGFHPKPAKRYPVIVKKNQKDEKARCASLIVCMNCQFSPQYQRLFLLGHDPCHVQLHSHDLNMPLFYDITITS